MSKNKKKNKSNNSMVIKYELTLRKRLSEEFFTFSNFTPHDKLIWLKMDKKRKSKTNINKLLRNK
jgi:hypothetical protein